MRGSYNRFLLNRLSKLYVEGLKYLKLQRQDGSRNLMVIFMKLLGMQYVHKKQIYGNNKLTSFL